MYVYNEDTHMFFLASKTNDAGAYAQKQYHNYYIKNFLNILSNKLQIYLNFEVCKVLLKVFF